MTLPSSTACGTEIGNLRDPAFHVLHMPAGHTWEGVHNTEEPLLGRALNDALAAIGRANPE